jgi:peptidoglycan DL-endopeptidase CwlO
VPTTDPSHPDPWLASKRRSRARRAEAVRSLRRMRGRRSAVAVLGASLALAGGAMANTTSSSTGGAAAASSVRGSGVAALQRALGIPADGVYGPQTRRAVRAFQRSRGLVVDGVAGPQTLGALGLPTNVVLGEDSPAAGASTVLSAVRSQLGAPYRWGGVGPASWDCSGLTRWAFRSVGIELPRTTYGQVGMGVPVSRANIQPGDLVFFDTDGSGPSHVGIATSATTVISATRSQGVAEHTSTGPYWGARYVGTRRVG